MILRSQHKSPAPSESSEAKKQPVTRGRAKKRAASQPAIQPIVMVQEEDQSRIVMYYSGSSQSIENSASSGASEAPPAWQSRTLTLSHPRTGEPAEYLLIDRHLQEVNWYKERYRSWLVGDSVLEDGSMYLCTPVHPLFLALPLMESSRMQAEGEQGVFCELDQLLQTDADESHAQLAELLQASVSCLCDVKDAGSDQYYRLNDVKVLAWLRCKVKVLRNALVDSSASFAGLGSNSLTIYVVGLLGEYLSEGWTKRLADSCHVSLEQPEAPLQPVNPDRNLYEDDDRAYKKPKFDPKEVAKKRLAEVKAEAKAEQVRRETKGMKSISSLFGSFKCKGK